MIIYINKLIALINYGIKTKKLYINIPFHKSILIILNIFVNDGYLYGFNFFEKNNKLFLKIKLKYYHNHNIFLSVKNISTSSHKIYWSFNQLKYYLNLNRNINYILSTNKGLISHKEAIKQKVGGLIVCSYI